MMKTKFNITKDLEQLIISKKFDNILMIINNPVNYNEINCNLWNFITTMCKTLKSHNLLEVEADFEKCKNILLCLVEKGNPKEIMIALLEECDTFKDNLFFTLLLNPLKAILLKLPKKRGNSLEWILSSLNAHIRLLPLPKDDFQCEEKLLLDVDSSVIDIVYVLQNYLDFISEFVKEATAESFNKNRFEQTTLQQDILKKYILFLFDRPFLYQDLHTENFNKPKSTIRILCEKYIEHLTTLSPNMINIFYLDISTKKTLDYERVPSSAYASLAYLTFAENLALESRPFVYSHQFLFIFYLKYANLLLERKENMVIFKGLHLAKVFLLSLEEFEIPYNFVELNVVSKFSKLLLSICIFSGIDLHRSLSLKLFLTYIEKCDWKGRYHTIMQVICTSNHSGAEGLVINLYKNYVNDCLNEKTFNSYILGDNFKAFIKKAFVLKDSVETDILENSDKIITALNFLRYLFLRDIRTINVTGIWNYIDLISDKFLKPLITALNLSRAHYKQAIVDSKENICNFNSTAKENSKVFSNAPLRFQEGICEKAILTFDLIESILFRVNELI